MRKRTRYSLLVVLALVVALVVALVLHKTAPPQAARLLPESDAIVYANLKPLRTATHFDRTPVKRSAEYQQFVDATGIVPERDLDAVAFALHRMDDPNGPNGPVAYSEVFEGRFDGARLSRYLGGVATSHESYAGHDVYTIPVGEPEKPGGRVRQLRIAQIGYDTIAASNMPTAEQIHSILDRARAAASPFSGSSLLSARYGDVPLLSSAWGIGHIGLPFSERGAISVMGMQLPLPEDTTFVASVRYVGSLRLRVEEIAPSEAEAANSAATLNTLLGLLRSIQTTQAARSAQLLQPESAADAALRDTLGSLKIEQHKERAVLTGSIPLELLKQLSDSSSSK